MQTFIVPSCIILSLHGYFMQSQHSHSYNVFVRSNLILVDICCSLPPAFRIKWTLIFNYSKLFQYILIVFKMMILQNVRVCACVCQCMLKREFLNPEVLTEVLHTGNGEGRVVQTHSCFNVRCISLWDYLCSQNCSPYVACQRCHVGFKDDKKEDQLSLELQLHCMSLKGNSNLHKVFRASNRPISTLAYI